MPYSQYMPTKKATHAGKKGKAKPAKPSAKTTAKTTKKKAPAKPVSKPTAKKTQKAADKKATPNTSKSAKSTTKDDKKGGKPLSPAASSQMERAKADRREKLAEIRKQVKDGSLVIRQMTPAERKRFAKPEDE